MDFQATETCSTIGRNSDVQDNSGVDNSLLAARIRRPSSLLALLQICPCACQVLKRYFVELSSLLQYRHAANLPV